MAVIEISSWTELDAIRADVSETARYLLTRSLLKTDVDYVGIGDSWVPISGMESGPMARCQFDMNGFTIEGLTTKTTSVYTGLFGRVGFEFCCENGTFDGAIIVSTGPSSGQGVVVGRILYSSPGWSIRNIKVRNSLINDGVTTQFFNGGIVGIVGDGRGPGSVNGNITDGVIEDCSVENCRIGGSGTSTGSSDRHGGISGWLRGGTIRRCNVRDTKIDTGGESPSYSGGICVALGSSLIEDCYVDGISFSGYRSTYSGGIASRFSIGTCTIRRCWVGDVDYSVTISGNNRRAIASVKEGTTNISDCFYDVDGYSWSGPGGGAAKTAVQMYRQATYTGWDFDTVWYINEGEDYPRLRGVDIQESIVPSIVGETQAAAEGIITAALFTVGTITGEYSDTVPIGVVISQSPEADTQVGIGSAIDFVVSLGPDMATMPTIIGLNIDAADALLLSSMLTTGTVSVVSGVGELYTVISQQYTPGTQLAIGTPVNYTILVPATDRDGFKTVIGYDNILSRSDVTLTASSTAAGTFVENIADGNTYDFWKSGEGVS
jgi:hypothetical protein